MTDKDACSDAIIESMSSICGTDHVTVSEEVSDYGFMQQHRPQLLVSPGSVEEIQEIVRFATASGVPLIALGGGTRIAQVLGRMNHGIAVCTRRLDRISEFEPGNLSLRCGSGTLPAAVRELTTDHNLQLAIFADFDHSTVGGQVASDFSGWKRYRYGASGDYVLGLSFVSTDGKHVSTGGKTVKNVSGYDFTRLLSGSWGRFGIITSVTFKLLPRPEKELLAVKDFSDAEEALEEGVDILSKVADPCSCNLIGDRKHADIRLVLCLEGSSELVSSQLNRLQLGTGWRLETSEGNRDTAAEEYACRRRAMKRDIFHTAAIDKRLLAKTFPLLRLLAKYHCSYDFDLSAGLLEFSSADSEETSFDEFKEAWQSAVDGQAGIRHTLVPTARPSAMFARIVERLDPHCIMFPDNLYSGGGDHD